MEKKFNDKDLNDAREFLLNRDGGKNAAFCAKYGTIGNWILDKARDMSNAGELDAYHKRLIAFATETGRETYAKRCELQEAIEHVYGEEVRRAIRIARKRRMEQAKPWDEMSEDEKMRMGSHKYDLGIFGKREYDWENEAMSVCAEKYHDKTVLHARKLDRFDTEKIKTIKEETPGSELSDEERDARMCVAGILVDNMPDEKCTVVWEYDPDGKEPSYIVAMK